MSAFRPFTSASLFSAVLKGALVDLVTFPPFFRIIFFRFFRLALLKNWDIINNQLKIDVAPKLMGLLPESYKGRLTSVQARLILAQLPKYEAEIECRIEIARRYHDGLSDIAGLRLPPWRDDGSHMYWHFPIQVDQRDDLVQFAAKEGRDIAVSNHRNCAELSCFEEFRRPCPNAAAASRSVIFLPTYPRFGSHEVDETIAVVRRYFGH